MLKARLAKIEKQLLPKDPPWVLCNIYADGVYELAGQRYANKEEFIKAVNPKNVIYMQNYISSLEKQQ